MIEAFDDRPLHLERPAPMPVLPRPAVAVPADTRVWDALLGAPPLSARELAALAAISRVRHVAPGGVVFDRDHPADALVFAREGDAALGSIDAAGHFQIERTVRGPGWLDQSSAWLDAAHAVDARATTPLVAVELPREGVQLLLQQHPALARRLIASLAREVHVLTRGTQELMHKDAPARFAAWLVQRFQPHADDPRRGFVKLGERKRDIASQLAVTPETLSRVMRGLTRQGLIVVAGYTVQVSDIDGLRAAAVAG
jgi:CRP-like cAMP-binding protein